MQSILSLFSLFIEDKYKEKTIDKININTNELNVPDDMLKYFDHTLVYRPTDGDKLVDDNHNYLKRTFKLNKYTESVKYAKKVNIDIMIDEDFRYKPDGYKICEKKVVISKNRNNKKLTHTNIINNEIRNLLANFIDGSKYPMFYTYGDMLLNDGVIHTPMFNRILNLEYKLSPIEIYQSDTYENGITTYYIIFAYTSYISSDKGIGIDDILPPLNKVKRSL